MIIDGRSPQVQMCKLNEVVREEHQSIERSGLIFIEVLKAAGDLPPFRTAARLVMN